MSSFKLKMLQNPFSAGVQSSPDTPPLLSPLHALGVSMSPPSSRHFHAFGRLDLRVYGASLQTWFGPPHFVNPGSAPVFFVACVCYDACNLVYLNKCIGDDTKAAARQSLNCSKNTNKIKYGEKRFSIWRMEFLHVHPAMWHVALES